jgi:hypothetical protein
MGARRSTIMTTIKTAYLFTPAPGAKPGAAIFSIP